MDRLRNIGIVAHINAGKTTLTERILFTSGKQRVMGEVDDGTATMDYLAEEQRRGISITAAVTRVNWKGHHINVIDTPGHVDFTAEVERCLRVMDGAVVVLDGVRGVESQTETVWRQADTRRIPRLVFVNKMDRTGADFAASIESLRERLGCRVVPIVLPVIENGVFGGLLDVVTGDVDLWADGATPPELRAARSAVVEACADFDESILADFVEEREVEGQRVMRALRQGVLAGSIVPVLGGAALLNRGVGALLDAVCRYLPSPTDAGAVRSLAADEPATRRPDPDEPFCALVFKSHAEEGESFAVARVYSGTVAVGDVLARSSEPGELAVESLWLIHADHREPVERAGPGDVVGLETSAEVRTGDTLFSPGQPIRLEPLRFPRPVLSARLEPRTEADTEAVEVAARALATDDPTLILDRDREREGLLVSGMGELHLEVFGSRLRRRIGELARLGRPTVAYMQTVERLGRGRAECRLAGERPMTSIVAVEIEPRAGEEATVESVVTGDSPRCAPLLAELSGWLRAGLADPYPALGVVVRIRELAGDASGEQGSVLDLEALSVACRKAVAAASPVLMEPLMSFEVGCPAEVLSGVLADLKSRSARLESVTGGPVSAVLGAVPLAAVLGYATDLRSLTRGLGTISLSPRGHIRCGA